MPEQYEFSEMINTDNFSIMEYEAPIDLATNSQFNKLALNPQQKIQVGALLQHTPAVAAAKAMSDVYVLTVPKGLPYTLMELKRGGYAGIFVGQDSKIVGIPALQKMTAPVAAVGAFTAMAAVSGQYFLSQINDEMKMMRQSVDEILNFLNDDKQSELLAEVSFVKYAFQNYSSIMQCDTQRIATIIGLQAAKKVATKNVEFYTRGLDSALSNKTDVFESIDTAEKAKDSLDLSIQLSTMSSLLEVYYSQNFDPTYLKWVESSEIKYITDHSKKVNDIFNRLTGRLDGVGKGIFSKAVKDDRRSAYQEKLSALFESLSADNEPQLCKSLRSALGVITSETTLYLTKNGDAYLKAI